MSTLPGRSKDTEESHFFREIIHILTSQWIKHWFEGRRAEKLFWLSSLFHRASGQLRRSPSPPARGVPTCQGGQGSLVGLPHWGCALAAMLAGLAAANARLTWGPGSPQNSPYEHTKIIVIGTKRVQTTIFQWNTHEISPKSCMLLLRRRGGGVSHSSEHTKQQPELSRPLSFWWPCARSLFGKNHT